MRPLIDPTSKMSFDSIKHLLCDDPSNAIGWLKDRKLLASKQNCACCGKDMAWTSYTKGLDGFAWRCNRRKCENRSKWASIRKGSIFEGSHLSLQKWIHVMYLWSLQTSQEKVAEILQISKPTLVSLYITMREIADM